MALILGSGGNLLSNSSGILLSSVSFPLIGSWAGDDWTLVLVPDTQLLLESYPEMFESQFQWIADNQTALNIQMVLHSGDIVESRLAVVEQEWIDADKAIDILDTAEIPYIMAQGNHDYDNFAIGIPSRDLTHFNTYLPPSRYTSHDWWLGGFYEAGHSENAYLLKSISGKDYIFFSIEYFPRDEVVTWLDGLLTTYHNREAIIVTHAFLHYDGTRIHLQTNYNKNNGNTLTDKNNAEEIWQMVIKNHDNVVLILSGHVMDENGLGSARLTSYSDNGYSVHQIVGTYHMPSDVENSGYIRLYTIKPSLGKIDVTTYSPPIDASKTGSADQFNVDYRSEN